ncbi:MAG: O-antigen ligase family protein [Chitinophagaceae bacterium]|nr:O-antigen ligase family protein [Chitinophagaceae bacterium]
MTLKTKILYATLGLAVATIPMKNQWNSIATILFVAAVVFQQPLSVSISRLKESRAWIIPVVYFVWLALSHFWDASGGYRLRDIERYLVLFFIPPVMAIAPIEIKKFIDKVCGVFIIVTTAICALCLVKAYMEYQVTHDYRVFYYQYLGEQMGLNAIFLSNYCLASIAWLLYFGFLGKKQTAARYTLICAAIVFLLLMIFMLSSKLLIFLTIVVMMVFILLLGYVKGFFVRSIIITSLIVIAGIVAIKQLPYLKWRVASTELKMYQGQEDDQNGIAIRLYMWSAVSDLISERPLMGYGIKGGRQATLKRYEDDGFKMGVIGDYHSHNQYLESLLMAGIPGIVLLLSMMFTVLRRAFTTKNFLLLLTVIHFMTQSLFESTFEVQQELVFYIFFIFLFYYHGPRLRNTLL